MVLKQVNIKAINSTMGEKIFFDDCIQTDNYIIIDVEETAQKIGRDIIDKNYELDSVDKIPNEEVYTWVEMLTEEITEQLKEEVWDYLYRNFE